MKVKDFKAIISAHLVTVDEDSFLQWVQDKKEDEPLDDSIIPAIKNLLIENWHQTVQYLPVAEWGKIPYSALIDSFTKHKIFSQNERADLIFPYLQARFHHDKSPSLTLDDYLAVLIRTARLCGYPEEQDLHYPVDRLSHLLTVDDVLRNRQAPLKRQTIMTSMAVLHFLIHKKCTALQQDLIQMAIWYRKDTTKEEQLAESLFFKFICENESLCKGLFKQQGCYIDMRIILENSELMKLRALLPERKPQLLDRVCFSESICLFLEAFRQVGSIDAVALQNVAVEAIHASYSKSAHHSLDSALTLANQLMEESRDLRVQIQSLFQNAILIFSLQEYVKCLTLDNRYHFFSFSPATKIAAANKMIQRMNGQCNELNFAESLAMREGRLGQILEHYKEQLTRDFPMAAII